MFCRKCGKEIKEGEKFCSQCGNAIVSNQNQMNIAEPKKSKSVKKRKLWKRGVLAAIALAVGIGGIWLYHQKNSAGHYLAYVCDENGKYGYVNGAGEEIIPCQYDIVYDFAENGLAKVGKETGKDEDNEPVYIYGYINRIGEEVITCQYDEIDDFQENGLAVFSKDEKKGIINEQGEERYIDQDLAIWEFGSNNLAMVVRVKDGNWEAWGWINEEGEEIIPCEYDRVREFSRNGTALVKKDEKWGCINEQGEEISPFQYDEAYDFSSNGLALVKRDEKWGYINEQGEEVVECKYEAANSFWDGSLAAVNEEGNWGYINGEGEEIIAFQYDFASVFAKNGLAVVMKNGKNICINLNGEEVLTLDKDIPYTNPYFGVAQLELWNEKEEIYEYSLLDVGCFGANVVVYEDEKFGLVNTSGEEVIPCEYTYFDEADEKGYFVGYKGDDFEKRKSRPVLLTLKGEIIVPERYEYIGSYGENDLAAVYDGSTCQYIDRKGNVVLELADKYVEAGKFVGVEN